MYRNWLEKEEVFVLYKAGECIDPYESAEVAQLVEHSPEKAGVRSSILRLGTRN
jgi:hypothetical protein